MSELSPEEKTSLSHALTFAQDLHAFISTRVKDEGEYEIFQQVVIDTATTQLSMILTQESEGVLTTFLRSLDEQIASIKEDLGE